MKNSIGTMHIYYKFKSFKINAPIQYVRFNQFLLKNELSPLLKKKKKLMCPMHLTNHITGRPEKNKKKNHITGLSSIMRKDDVYYEKFIF